MKLGAKLKGKFVTFMSVILKLQPLRRYVQMVFVIYVRCQHHLMIKTEGLIWKHIMLSGYQTGGRMR